MANTPVAIEEAIEQIERLRRNLKKSSALQVRSNDERSLVKATASAWFSNHQPAIEAIVPGIDLGEADDGFKSILEASDRHGARSKYVATLSVLKKSLINLRSRCVDFRPGASATNDQAPDFSPLILDQAMQQILTARWEECVVCVAAGAPLAATVMMGGLLEAILLGRVNRESDKAALFTASQAPKNSKTGKPKNLSEWMLNDFIKVLAELNWITVSASAVSNILRDYRNYIHPQKQLSHDMHLKIEDAQLFWDVAKIIVRQVLLSASLPIIDAHDP